MTIDQAMRAASDEYDADVARSRSSPAFLEVMAKAMEKEYKEMDVELPAYVAEIAVELGQPKGTRLDPWIYQLARMCFRMGMRTQRKIDHPSEATSVLWRRNR